MNPVGLLSKATSLRYKSGVGMYRVGDTLARVEAGKTITGIQHNTVAHEPGTAISVRPGSVELLWARVPAKLLGRLGAKPHPEGREPERQGAGNIMLGLRASAVTFLSEAITEQQPGAGAAGEREEVRIERGERRAATVLSDSMTVTVAGHKILLTGKVRLGELDEIAKAAGLDPVDPGARYEPEPCAAWRASAFYAPFKPAKGIHLRFILGDGHGLAILGTPKWPLAWQVLAWEEGGKEEAVLQAFHLLSVHALRRLHLSGIDHISIQGEGSLEGDWDRLGQTIGQPLHDVDGPNYGPEFVSLGLALGAMQSRTETLNLAHAIQPSPSLWASAPWGEAGFLLSLVICMCLVLRYTAGNLEHELDAVNRENLAVTWAKGIVQAKLTAEQKALMAQVTPMIQYLKRDMYFSDVVTAIAGELPDATWLDGFEGGDLIWEKNPNKMLGQRYVLIQAGAPSARHGLAPPEIDEAVHSLEQNEFLRLVLPRVKLTDVNWRQQSGRGYTVFSILALPKE
jgi:hypothetical protein